MRDGSIILSEEHHRDVQEDFVILHRPLQICLQLIGEERIQTFYIPWLPGASEQVRVNISDILAENDAAFDQKFAYSRYYLMSYLQKFLSPADYMSIVNESKACQSAPSNQELPVLAPKLKHELSKQKRFHLN